MKKTLFILSIICVLQVLTAADCTKDTTNRHYHINFKNNSKTTIWVIHNGEEFPDTLIPSWERDPRVDSMSAILPGENSAEAIWSWDFFECEYGYTVYGNDTVGYDTLSVYVFNDDTLARYGWQTVRENYLVHQRYDLSLDDLKLLNWQLYFPPSEEMRDIKMWPPYGTYDANGHRVE